MNVVFSDGVYSMEVATLSEKTPTSLKYISANVQNSQSRNVDDPSDE